MCLTYETRSYIQEMFNSGMWEHVPKYLGVYCAVAPIPGQPFAVHKSLTQPGLIAFYGSFEKAEAKRETIMKVGRFLAKFQPDWSQEEIRRAGEQYASENSEMVLEFATTPDEIEQVYVNGPRSCMAGPASNFSSEIHPTRVYGAGDLAVAHYGTKARVLCWPKKLTYGRIYAESEAMASKMAEALESLGYNSKGKFSGARLLRIQEHDKFVCPYLDGEQSVEDSGDFLRIGGNLIAGSTSGLIYMHEETCEICDSAFDPEDSNCSTMCDSCYDEHSWCEECEETVHNNNMTYVESADRSVCNSCLRHNYSECVKCNENFRDDETVEVEDGRVTRTYCLGCAAEHAAECTTCCTLVVLDGSTVTHCGEAVCSDEGPLSCHASHIERCTECYEHSQEDTIDAGDTSDNLELVV